MDEKISGADAQAESMRRRLGAVRRALLHLHKALLDAERAAYEQARGRVTSGEMLQLVINHEQFAWLRSISELIVRIDEALDADEPLTEGDAAALLAHTQARVAPAETGDDFGRKYYAALQREPAAVLAHRELVRTLSESV